MQRLFFAFALLLTTALPAQVPELVVPAGHTRNLLTVVSDPAGGRVATSSTDETVKVWDLASGRELTTFRPGNAARDLAFTADGRHLIVAAFNRIYVLRTTDWKVVRTVQGWNTDGVRAHPAKNEIYYFTQRANSTGEDPLQVFALSLPGGQPRLLTRVERDAGSVVARLDLTVDGDRLLLVQAQNSHLIPTSGGPAIAAADARRFTPDGDLFFLQNTGSNTTFGVRSLSGTLRWELATAAAGITNRNLVDALDFDAASGKFYWLNTTDRLASGSYRTGQPTMSVMPAGLDRSLTVTPDGNLVAAANDPFSLRVYRLPSLASPRTFGEPVLSPRSLAGSTANGQLSWGAGGAVKTLRLAGRKLLPYGGAEGAFSAGPMGYSAGGDLLSAASFNGDVFSYQAPLRHARVQRFKSGLQDARTTATDRSGEKLVVVAADGYLVMDTRTNKSIGKGAPAAGDNYFDGHTALSPNGNRLLLKVARNTEEGQTTRSVARLVNLADRSVAWEKPVVLEDPVFSADGQRIFASTFQHLGEYNAVNGRELRLHPLPNGRFPQGVTFAPARQLAVYTHDDRAFVYDLAMDREYPLSVPRWEIPFDRITLFHEDFAVAAGREGILRVFDLRTRRYVGALTRYADTDDWALVGADGRFDASPGAMRRMYYRINNELVALEQLFTGFYTPGLAGEIFGRLPAGSLPPARRLGDLHPAPSVELSYRPANSRGLGVEDDEASAATFIRARTQDAVLRIKGDAPDDRIAELRLYRNDKLLADGVRGLGVEDDVPDAPSGGERNYRVRLLPGTNAFRAVALNAQGTESPPVYLTVDYVPDDAPAPPPPPVPAGAVPASGPADVTLHLVTVGIDNYANPKYNLNYATADAGALETALSRGAAKLAGNIVVHAIRDAGATRREVLERLQEVVAAADADDLFVFFFAGHGLVPDPGTGKFYLVPHDVTKPYDANHGLRARGISAASLQQLSASLPAERQLFLLDACQSGGALRDLRRGAAEEKAVASLARTTGTHWLTATDSRQLAAEFDALGHGAFTYVLLEGLAGKADDGDGRVTVNGLRRYLEQALPELTRRQTGTAQFPSGHGFGRDFLIAR